MTLPKLRELAAKAKAFRPPNNCREHPIVACGACAVCLGAKQAVEDIAKYVAAAICCFDEEYEAASPHDQSMCEIDAMASCHSAVRIASYFGPPGDVEAFAAAVREMCNG